jgi:hypothetical protein
MPFVFDVRGSQAKPGAAAPRGGTRHPMLQLQAAAGNRAVADAVQRADLPVGAAPTGDTAAGEGTTGDGSTPDGGGNGFTNFPGVLQCDTLVANSVIASSYSPGAGNLF